MSVLHTQAPARQQQRFVCCASVVHVAMHRTHTRLAPGLVQCARPSGCCCAACYSGLVNNGTPSAGSASTQAGLPSSACCEYSTANPPAPTRTCRGHADASGLDSRILSQQLHRLVQHGLSNRVCGRVSALRGRCSSHLAVRVKCYGLQSAAAQCWISPISATVLHGVRCTCYF
jgi:hypothetical protein